MQRRGTGSSGSGGSGSGGSGGGGNGGDPTRNSAGHQNSYPYFNAEDPSRTYPYFNNTIDPSPPNPYANYVPTRPAPPPPGHPPRQRSSGHTRQTSLLDPMMSMSGRSSNAPQDSFARRGSLAGPSGLSGLSATRPSGSDFDFGLPPLQLPPSSMSLSSPRLGSSNTGSALGPSFDYTPTMDLPPLDTGGTAGRSRRRRTGAGGGNVDPNNDFGGLPPLGTLGGVPPLSSFPSLRPLGRSQTDNNTPSMYSQSQPLNIEDPSPFHSNDWRHRRPSAAPLENPVNRETRREARHRTLRDWEEDGELHPNVDLDSNLSDSTDGELDDPSLPRPRRRTRSIRRVPSVSNLRQTFADDSGIDVGHRRGTSAGFGGDSLDLGGGLSGLSLGGSGLSGFGSAGLPGLGAGDPFPPMNTRRGGLSSHLDALPPLDFGLPPPPSRRGRNHPPPSPGPPPTGPLPPLPDYAGEQGGRGGLGGLRRRTSLSNLGGGTTGLGGGLLGGNSGSGGTTGYGSTTGLGGFDPRTSLQVPFFDPFATPAPRVPGQHRIREHMVEFTDGDYTVRIRHNQRARQEQQQRNRQPNGDNHDDQPPRGRQL